MEAILTKHRNMTYLQLGLILGLFFLLYYPVITKMVSDWGIDDNYSHGYLIPAIAGYMIWIIRKDLKKIEPTPGNLGLILLIPGLCQLLVARVGSEYFLQRTSMILVLFGLSLFLMGKKFTKKASFPMAYLFFMIPVPAIIWDKIAFPMKLFASYLAVKVIGLIGIPIFREGNILHLANTTLEVADACSGLRSLTSLLALSAALVFFTEHSRFKKWLLFLSAVPIAILTNIIRLTVTAGLASRYGEKVAQGFLHEFSGWLIFLLGLAMLMGVNALLSQKIKFAMRNPKSEIEK
ncbi:MAG: exosortase/archaeosortase family protein [Thermodesulfobacteriota bacterium]|nr:exosortase/archaeosortase family protein [Thermodesulfobacteriota bacterium]